MISLLSIAGVLYYINSTLNPLIYSVMSSRFRRAFKDVLAECREQNCSCSGRRRGSQNTDSLPNGCPQTQACRQWNHQANLADPRNGHAKDITRVVGQAQANGHARSLSNGHGHSGSGSHGTFFPAHHSAAANFYGDKHSYSSSSSSGRRRKANGHTVRYSVEGPSVAINCSEIRDIAGSTYCLPAVHSDVGFVNDSVRSQSTAQGHGQGQRSWQLLSLCLLMANKAKQGDPDEPRLRYVFKRSHHSEIMGAASDGAGGGHCRELPRYVGRASLASRMCVTEDCIGPAPRTDGGTGGMRRFASCEWQ